jgi:hypothetical protein
MSPEGLTERDLKSIPIFHQSETALRLNLGSSGAATCVDRRGNRKMKVQEIFKGVLIRACVATSLFIVLFAIQVRAQKILATVPMPPSVCCAVAVNPSLNRVYVSGGASKNQEVFVLNGATFKGGSPALEAEPASTAKPAIIGPRPFTVGPQSSAPEAITLKSPPFPPATAAPSRRLSTNRRAGPGSSHSAEKEAIPSLRLTRINSPSSTAPFFPAASWGRQPSIPRPAGFISGRPESQEG